jgi:hypothetical protein
MEGDSVCNLETKFHGINGQLPNLDFVNLLNKFIVADIVSSVPFAIMDLMQLFANFNSSNGLLNFI